MMSLSAVMSGVTAHKISKTITYLLNESKAVTKSPKSKPKPLLLLLPWLGSRPQGLAKYCEIYFRTGFDVLVVETEVSQFLWPRWGLDYGAKVLEVLERDAFISRPLLVHAFSIGGYTFTQLLNHIPGCSQQCQSLADRIKGQIYDSLVIGSLEHMATGLGKTLFPQWEGLFRQASLLYFRAFKKHTVDYFKSSVDLFWNHPVTAPALFFFCENDPLCDYNKMEELIECWRSAGMVVEGKKWKESIHAAHLRQHPEEYLAVLESFLRSLDLVPLKAKM
ncbi:transmembrane protein 53-A [Scleropages formosus]|uniref:Si:dkey-5i3.5 n=1 Tax=Scleropages formosus TaxID=113540 RepID=A0A8C9R6U0_SCLFO|nr:transmembrane protein 53-A-like [Scleropages formosus]